jgi:hypothetical protein
MQYVYIFIGMFVSIIALFKRELLVQKDSFRIILGASIALFLCSFILHMAEGNPGSFSGALLAPLLSLGLYRFYRVLFVQRIHREPKDTFFDWASGLTADRLFNIVYFGSAVWLELFAMAGMMELARAGW